MLKFLLSLWRTNTARFRRWRHAPMPSTLAARDKHEEEIEMTDQSKIRAVTPEELKAALDEIGGVPSASFVLNGKPLHDLNDQELAAAIMYFKVSHEAADREFSEAHQKHMSFHGCRAAVLFEYDRRQHQTKLVGPSGRPL